MNNMTWCLGVAIFVLLAGCDQAGVLAVSQEQPLISDDVDNDGVPDREDCEPNNSDIYPGADDVCDGIDNDCDGEMDEDGELSFYEDADGDGFGNDQSVILACTAPTNFVLVVGDCRDDDPTVYPGAFELCDGVDNDCDGNVPSDEVDADGDRYVECVWVGNSPDFDGGSDCDETRDDIHPNAFEGCDGIDYNCDGYTGDGDNDGDGVSPCGGDCDDGEVNNFPGNAETCDGIDNDCDGDIDADDANVTDVSDWYPDIDSDGHGAFVPAVQACTQPLNHVVSNDDCDDGEATVYPGANEVLVDGIDQDCDGFDRCYLDDDNDGYGNDAFIEINDDNLDCRDGSNNESASADDCNDMVAVINPGESEICDGLDNDCNGSVDDTAIDALTWYEDFDADGFGNLAVTLDECNQPLGYVVDDQDCDDNDVNAHPGAIEVVADGTDQNCDLVDDCYEDLDEDGYGSTTVVSGVDLTCTNTGESTEFTDCDDGNVIRYPGNLEICDGIDNDCTLSIPLNEIDGDIDGYMVCSGDCDDNDVNTYPGAIEVVADGTDQNCDSVDDCYEDIDGDGFGSTTVISGSDLTCMNLDESTRNDDCDDTDIGVYIGEMRYFDADGDGYGDPNAGLFDCPTAFTVDYVVDGTDCNDAQAVVNPGAIEEPYTVWDDDCDGTAHGDGTTAYPTAGSDIYFTGPNLIANPTADSDFDAGVVQDWHVYVSDEGYSDTDLTVSDTLWSSAFLPAGTYSRYDILLASVLRGGNSECSLLGPFTVSVGQQYSVSFVAQSDNTLDMNTISVYTQTYFDTFVPAFDVVNIPPFGGELSVVSTFIATVTTESIVICHGQVGSNGAGMTGGGGAGWTHVWFGTSTY